jgi:hypothetical protein
MTNHRGRELAGGRRWSLRASGRHEGGGAGGVVQKFAAFHRAGILSQPDARLQSARLNLNSAEELTTDEH